MQRCVNCILTATDDQRERERERERERVLTCVVCTLH